MYTRYRLVFARKGARVEDGVLQEFVQEIIRGFGGLDLLSRVDVKCNGGIIGVEADEEASNVVHGSLFFCGEYKSVKCRFEQVD
ncbi:hypothetical protein EROM_081240 [Encephalitozoon romaleae SJ-2008]|uniref:Uncharacterized protein n=1 Tax=Encephalitozoon romaleae (strain SJ-2008) TaxID=1178016 RepID=I7AFM5_ENCRO|nr:hypothetical protein EROM_081240 [Encephalitozoon romaleae SJ-2008]AFN83540.1 hypothetical protein EROM_081240 [Encephalitozoon romaleae SJ-2008]